MTDLWKQPYNNSLPVNLIDTALVDFGVAETQNGPSVGNHGALGMACYQGIVGTTQRSIPAGLVFIVSAALCASTGARWSFNHAGYTGPGSFFPTISIVEGDKRRAHIFVPAAHQRMLKRVRDAFRLSMTDLAGVFHVSRTAAYDWFKGAGPRAEQMERLIKFNDYAVLVESKSIQRIDFLAKVPLSNGKTLLQLLSTDEDIRQAIEEIEELSLQRSQSMDRRRQLIAGKEKTYGADDTTPFFSSFE
jgi:hypothetical protein